MTNTNKKTWIEVCLNSSIKNDYESYHEISMKTLVDEGINCIRNGASIISIQINKTGNDEYKKIYENFTKVASSIRAKGDAIIYPIIDPNTFLRENHKSNLEVQFEYLEELAKLKIIDWLGFSPDSTNISHYDRINEDIPGYTKIMTEKEFRKIMTLSAKYHVNPILAVTSPTSVRTGATLHWRTSSAVPVYTFIFSTGYTCSFPPEDYGLTAYLNLLDQVAPGSPWFVSGFDADISFMIPRIVMEGGNVRVSSYNLPKNESKMSNPQLVEQASKIIVDSGGTVASVEDVRDELNPDETKRMLKL